MPDPLVSRLDPARFVAWEVLQTPSGCCGPCWRVRSTMAPADALWTGVLGHTEPLCTDHVGVWLGNAYDDPDLQASAIEWIDGHNPPGDTEET